MSEPTNLPDRNDRPGAAWDRFRQDPRRDAALRASDSDRDVAREVLAEAYADGQLDHDEYLQRLEVAGAATRHGELVPLVGDLTVSPTGSETTPRPAASAPAPGTERRRRRGLDHAVTATMASWLFVAIVTNLVWFLTSVGDGEADYYWPMWPMLGVGIGVIGTIISRGAIRNSQDPDDPRELDR
ncbi:hypothetical protein CGZ94_18100 [Enemella evansiae]|uniref:DUF1707 domain-containing protein n=1 Tax=Enemella evansiae TaxID=2016499 RepID=A0A255G5B1_9ACTN|nr:DUF1707 domain-containing protein [Enemella evansiae]OYO09576.1 hypothetical protein CGZ94_18100 [Enemella evansiae]OYO20684.1 hypothetical protein BI335_01445 [Enemella evansiae]